MKISSKVRVTSCLNSMVAFIPVIAMFVPPRIARKMTPWYKEEPLEGTLNPIPLYNPYMYMYIYIYVHTLCSPDVPKQPLKP